MSIADFQRALGDMTLDSTFAAAVLRQGASALAAYELTSFETSRLMSVVRQPGMSVNCTLARANRFASIADRFPLTCSLLKPQLRPLIDELWRVHKPSNYQLAGEAEAFAELLSRKLSARELDYPYAEEIFRYECAAWELIRTLQRAEAHDARESAAERCATVAFRHDPEVLLRCLERDESPPRDLPAGDYRVRLILRGDTLEVQAVD